VARLVLTQLTVRADGPPDFPTWHYAKQHTPDSLPVLQGARRKCATLSTFPLWGMAEASVPPAGKVQGAAAPRTGDVAR
jgi:hypothetical protein